MPHVFFYFQLWIFKLIYSIISGMKKIFILLTLILFFANSAIAEDNIFLKKDFYKNIFNFKQLTKSETTESNTTEEQVNFSADAMILYNANDIEGALQILENIPDEKKTALDLLLMGNIYQDKKDTVKAATFYKQATIKDIKFYKGYYNLGNLYLDEDNFQEAIKLYKSAIKYKHDFGYAYYNLGCAYVKIGDLNKAKNSFLKAKEYKNDLPEIYYNLAFVYKNLNNKKKAEEFLKIYNELMTRKLW